MTHQTQVLCIYLSNSLLWVGKGTVNKRTSKTIDVNC